MSESPRPIEYALPPRKRSAGRRVFLIVLAAIALTLFGLWATGLVQVTRTSHTRFAAPASSTARPVGTVVLPHEPTEFHCVQRTSFQLPGDAQTPTIALGDVTGGQVMVRITQAGGGLLYSQPMKAGDVATVVNGQQTVHVKLIRFDTSLTKDDKLLLSVSAALPLNEPARIDALIAHLESLDGATFIRNGSPHTAKEAAAHLKRKRDYVGDKITTAEQFIDELASKSSQSGEAYTIKLKDGSTVQAGEYLKDQLPKIDAALRGKK